MLLPSSVFDVEVKLAQFFQPASQLPLRGLETEQPHQAPMIGPQAELPP